MVVGASAIVPLIFTHVLSALLTSVTAPSSRQTPQPAEPEKRASFLMSIMKIPEIWAGAKAQAKFFLSIVTDYFQMNAFS